MHIMLVQLLILLVVANGAPILARRILRGRLAYRVDFGIILFDNRPLLGRSKTIRGIVSSVILTTALAPILELDWTIGLLIGLTAMVGALFSSFLKRRYGIPESHMALGLDQIPESLFPLFACQTLLKLDLIDVAIGVLAFFVSELVLSKIFYVIGVRDHPY